MRCLCCGKVLPAEREAEGWHKSCIRNFFGTAELPEIDMGEEVLEALAMESTSRGYTVPGVQKKLSLHLFSEKGKARLTLVNYPTGYILKPQVAEYPALPEAESLVMNMAKAAGIATVPHALLRSENGFSYITKRVDRSFEKGLVKKYAMEDFCQLDLRLTQDKYKGSYERCAKIIDRYSSRKGLDMSELFMRVVFSCLIGNSDMHLKNFSLIETEECLGQYILSPAYDLLPVNVILPEDEDWLALSLNGKKRNIHKKDFLVFAEECGIPQKTAEKMIGKLVAMKSEFIGMCRDSWLPQEQKERFVLLMEERFGAL